MKSEYNTLIIGSGCAGFNAAKRLYDLGVKDIAVITEGIDRGTSRNTGSDKQTYYKLSLCGDEGDSVREMAKTLFDGGGVNGDIALVEAAYSVRCFMQLVELGVPFPANEYGEYAGYKTDHDPRSRATSCGPLTSKLMTEALEDAVNLRNIEIIDDMRAVKVITDDGQVQGVAAVSVKDGGLQVFSCKNVILCTGGPAHIYKNTVYPESQRGGSGLAIEAGASMTNLDQWQYGIASVKFRWNLSGSYQQVIPRYVSVDEEGNEREFLYDELGKRSLDLIFLKGYQWPFDSRKTEASSLVDILVARQIKLGRRVFIDFIHDPKGLEKGYSVLSEEAINYLTKSDALLDTPIERLEKMNSGAVKLYASHGIDLHNEYLEIAVCAQHCNGGVAVDSNWESDIRGLYVAGEAAGTFGVYRPGGSALNSTQVGSLRAAEHISFENSKTSCVAIPKADFDMPKIKYGKSNIEIIRNELQNKMSICADFERSLSEMKKLYDELCELSDAFFDIVIAGSKQENAELFLLYDQVLTQKATLSAMLCSAKKYGSHGSAYIKDGDRPTYNEIRDTETVTTLSGSYFRMVRPIPDAELWFEKLLARKYSKSND